MDNIERKRIGVADPARFGGDPRARWLSPGDELREDWNEVEYVPASQFQKAVDRIVARIENLLTFQRRGSASELPAVDRDAVLSIVRFHLEDK